jgi:hypothetical protein
MRYEEVATLMTRIDVGQARYADGAASIVSVKMRPACLPRALCGSIDGRSAREVLPRAI